jgi:hypothetical protein
MPIPNYLKTIAFNEVKKSGRTRFEVCLQREVKHDRRFL